MKLLQLLFGDLYEFRHPSATNAIRIRARSEAKAWKKMRSIIQLQMYGPLALTYNPIEVQRALTQCEISKPNT